MGCNNLRKKSKNYIDEGMGLWHCACGGSAALEGDRFGSSEESRRKTYSIHL
jgi:hypothetical protein